MYQEFNQTSLSVRLYSETGMLLVSYKLVQVNNPEEITPYNN